MKTKPASSRAEGKLTPIIEEHDPRQSNSTHESHQMKSSQGDVHWKQNAFRILAEMKRDSERFHEGMVEAKKSLKDLERGLEEQGNSKVRLEKGIVSVRCQLLEMEVDLAWSGAHGFRDCRLCEVNEGLPRSSAEESIGFMGGFSQDNSEECQHPDSRKRKVITRDDEAAEKGFSDEIRVDAAT